MLLQLLWHVCLSCDHPSARAGHLHSPFHTRSVSHCSTLCYCPAQFHTFNCTLSISFSSCLFLLVFFLNPLSLSTLFVCQMFFFLPSLLCRWPPPMSTPRWLTRLSTTCQFLGGRGLFGDRWRSAFHLDGDPGAEAGLGGREQLLIGQGVSPCQ